MILATHLNGITKSDLGLPNWDSATERQRRDGMCWRDPKEPYNDGVPFKLTARDASGVIVTIISDNYFGYCKKEVKTQISYAANLLGGAEEEHAGGAIAFPSYDLGEHFRLPQNLPDVQHTFAEALALLGDRVELLPDGWARDKQYSNVYYVPADASFDMRTQRISWAGSPGLKLLPGITYLLPSGYKVEMVNPDEGRRWRLRGTTAEGLLCHKPCTVSGGGKSEISKPIADAIFTGPVFVSDLASDLERVDAILRRDYTERFHDPRLNKAKRQAGPEPGALAWKRDQAPEPQPRLLGRVQRLAGFDTAIHPRPGPPRQAPLQAGVGRRLAAPVQRRHNQCPARARAQVPRGATADPLSPGRLHKGRRLADLHAADGLSARREDPGRGRHHRLDGGAPRPGAVPSGLGEGAFGQVRPQLRAEAFPKAGRRDHPRATTSAPSATSAATGSFSRITSPSRWVRRRTSSTTRSASRISRIRSGTCSGGSRPEAARPTWCRRRIPGIVDGKPSKNPRYLQNRPDLEDPRATYIAHTGARLFRRVEANGPAQFPVGSVLMGRRLNPPEPGVRPLCVFGPIHYQELPEAFMDLIASLTGKSPSTTGAGSEGALTKGPFNALPPIYDLNAALVSFVLTGLPIFSTAAGWVGPRHRVDHDISLLVPEIWCRMTPPEREPEYLIREGLLERCKDFDHNGKRILASRLGWRITARFVQTFFGRVLGNPSAIFDDEFLRPETQDQDVFAEGVDNMVGAMRDAAGHYFADASVEEACPPLKALLHIMRDGTWEGRTSDDPVFRDLFKRGTLLQSDWYRARLVARQSIDARLAQDQIRYLEKFLTLENYSDVAAKLDIPGRLAWARAKAAAIREPSFIDRLVGTLGAEPAIAARLSKSNRGL